MCVYIRVCVLRHCAPWSHFFHSISFPAIFFLLPPDPPFGLKFLSYVRMTNPCRKVKNVRAGRFTGRAVLHLAASVLYLYLFVSVIFQIYFISLADE
jgi:hypothetical protein